MEVLTTTIDALTSTLSRQEFQHSVLVYLIVGVLLAFLLGFSLGAHDVANTFGTSTAGALLLGYNVVESMRKGVVDTELYVGEEREYFIGQLAVLAACSLWLLITTFMQLPVSSSHSIVGSTVGFSIALKGLVGINWSMIYSIAASWVISPLFSGLVSGTLYVLVDMLILRRDNPIKWGLACIPFFYFFCIAFNVFNIVFQGSKILGIEHIPFGWSMLIAIGSGLVIGLAVQFCMRPFLIRYINKADEPTEEVKTDLKKPTDYDFDSNLNDGGMAVAPASPTNVPRQQRFGICAEAVFTACFAGFAHGANDVGNAISPVAAMLSVYLEDSIWVFVFGAVSIVIGLWCLGHKIIVVVGSKMSHIHPASGFTIEFGAALGLPISTTHSLIGSVVTVGSLKSGRGVDWSIFRNIVFAWLVTLPVTVGLSACLTLLLKWLVM
ncbi:Phosphate transporter [Aphelenchoides fujianensis]|nr:Phosphate transporter [Aphelenchoides fujianensis]